MDFSWVFPSFFRSLRESLARLPLFFGKNDNFRASEALGAAILLGGRFEKGCGGDLPYRQPEAKGDILLADLCFYAPTKLHMQRYTKPEKVHQLLLEKLGFRLPDQPPPQIKNPMPVVETF